MNNQKRIFLVLSDTGSLLSRCIKMYTKAPYNHVSISFDASLSQLYSFGRRHARNPFWGGFVEESFYSGTFKRFKNTRCKVLSLEVSDEEYLLLNETVNEFIINKNKYHYNFIGLLGLPFNLRITRKDGYYCSEFVAEVMERSTIIAWDVPPFRVQPYDFTKLESTTLIYEGLSAQYQKA